MRTRVYLGILILLAFVSLLALPAHAQFTTITATDIQAGDGSPLAAGSMCWLGTNNAGTAIGYRAGTSGQTITAPVCRDIVSGAVATTYKGVAKGALQVADTTLTQPANVCYKVTVTDTSTGKVVLGSYAGAKSGYDCVQPSGSTWSFDTYTPAGTPGIVQITGPQGAQGIPGPATVTTDTATVVTPAAGPSVANTGTTSAAIFHFSLPRARSFSIGTVTSLLPGNSPTVAQSTDSNGDITFNFGIPQGGTVVTGSASSGNTVLASLMTGSDVCQRISAAWTFASGLGWHGAQVDATDYHNIQPCSVNMWTNFPNTPGATPFFAGRVKFSNDVGLLLDVRQVQPSQTQVDFQSPHAGYFRGTLSSISGGAFGPSNIFSDTTLWELGVQPASGGTPPQGVRLDNAGITCVRPNGTVIAGATAVLNRSAQELSGASNITVNSCNTPLDVHFEGIQGGAQNSGSYDNWHVYQGLLSDSDMATATGARLGTNASGTVLLGSYRNWHISCVNVNLTQCPAAAYLDGSDAVLDTWKIEAAASGIHIGENQNVYNVNLRNIMAQGGSGGAGYGPMAEVVKIPLGHTVQGVVLQNIRSSGPSQMTNVIADLKTNGCTIPASELVVGQYIRNSTASVPISDSPSCQPTGPLQVVTTHSADYTLLPTDNNAVHTFNSAPAVNVFLPAVTPTSGWTSRVINYGAGALTINANGHTMNGSTGNMVIPGGASGGAMITTNGTNFYVWPGTLATPTFVPTIVHGVLAANYTASSADDKTFFPVGCATACTFTLPATPPASGWTIEVLSYGAGTLTVSPNGNFLDAKTTNFTIGGGASAGDVTVGGRIVSSGSSYYWQPGNVGSYKQVVSLFGSGSCSGFLKNDGSCSTGTVTSNNIAVDMTDHATTGTGADQTVYTTSVPSIGPGKGLEMVMSWAKTTGTGANTVKVTLGGGTIFNCTYTTGSTSTAVLRINVQNGSGVQNAQRSTSPAVVVGTSPTCGGTLTPLSLDFTTSQTLNVIYNSAGTEANTFKYYTLDNRP
jgi:hypothetical protein